MESLSLSSYFLVLLFSINLSRGERKRHFYRQQASILHCVDEGSLVLIICGIWLRDVGLSQVAAYMPIALCGYLDALSKRPLILEDSKLTSPLLLSHRILLCATLSFHQCTCCPCRTWGLLKKNQNTTALIIYMQCLESRVSDPPHQGYLKKTVFTIFLLYFQFM